MLKQIIISYLLLEFLCVQSEDESLDIDGWIRNADGFADDNINDMKKPGVDKFANCLKIGIQKVESARRIIFNGFEDCINQAKDTPEMKRLRLNRSCPNKKILDWLKIRDIKIETVFQCFKTKEETFHLSVNAAQVQLKACNFAQRSSSGDTLHSVLL